MGDRQSPRGTQLISIVSAQKHRPYLFMKTSVSDLCAVVVSEISTSSHLVCTGLAFSPAGAVGTADRDTVIFARWGSGQRCPSFSAQAPLSYHPPTPVNLALNFAPGERTGRGWGVGAGKDVILAPRGTVSQNYIFMLAATI